MQLGDIRRHHLQITKKKPLTLANILTLSAPLFNAHSNASTAPAPPPNTTTFLPSTSTLSNSLECILSP